MKPRERGQAVEEAFVPDREDRPSRHQRGEPRDSMFLQAMMLVVGEKQPIQVRVRNLSAGGLMGDCSLPLAQGQEVEFEIRNIGVVPGRIAWADGQRIGVAFDLAIDPQLARKPVGTKATDSRLVPRPSIRVRRPGLRIE
jgi:hypothetical protein